jgi:hypothetical protein
VIRWSCRTVLINAVVSHQNHLATELGDQKKRTTCILGPDYRVVPTGKQQTTKPESVSGLVIAVRLPPPQLLAGSALTDVTGVPVL